MTREEFQELKQYTLSKQYVEDLAYAIWEADGKPNGEQIVETFWFGLIPCGKMKLKDMHWQKAEMIRDFDLQIVVDFEMILSEPNCERNVSL
jgi:hypothetical protein